MKLRTVSELCHIPPETLVKSVSYGDVPKQIVVAEVVDRKVCWKDLVCVSTRGRESISKRAQGAGELSVPVGDHPVGEPEHQPGRRPDPDYSGALPRGTAALPERFNTPSTTPTQTPRFDRRTPCFRPRQASPIGIQKAFWFHGGRNRLKLILDGFNMFNENTILGYSSPNITKAGYTQPSSIVSPRVFRVGTSITFDGTRQGRRTA